MAFRSTWGGPLGRRATVRLLLVGVVAAGSLGTGLARAETDRSPPKSAHAHQWPAHPIDLELLLAYHDFEIVGVKGGVGGVMGVKRVELRFPDGQKIPVKWKAAPAGDADGWNNTPRKEIAAYVIQKWFLDPVDFVVPTTVVRCIPLDQYGAISSRKTRPNIAGTSCVTGAFSAWLSDVTVPETLHDEERFASDPIYAHHLADFNLLAYLIEHEDGRGGNILVATDDDHRRVFAVDNGVAFGAWVKNYWVRNWNKVRVAALRKQSIDRLRQIKESQLEALGVLSEHRAGEDGVLRPVPFSANADPDHGSRVAEGWLQLGLTEDEIEDIEERLKELIEAVDSGEQPVF